MEEEHTSPQTGATPATGTPATGTPALTTPTVEKPTITLEEALKKLADLEHSQTNAKEEVERHRKKLTSYEKAEKEALEAKRLAEEAQLSEIERTKKQYADLQSQHDSYVNSMKDKLTRYEIENQASKLGIIDPEAAWALLNKSSLEYDENGTPTNTEKLLKDLIKVKSYLVAPPPSTEQKPPATPSLNPGRSVINPSGQLPIGTPIRLADIWKRQ